MKCKDFEQDIYLYSEFSEAERVKVDAHIQECAACKELFQAVLSTQAFIAESSIIKPELANHGKLTSNIMQAVTSRQNQSAPWIPSLFLRYSMVATSLALIVMFIQEQQVSVNPLQRQQIVEGMVKLNSEPASEILKRKKEKTGSLYACAKSGVCDNILIENFKQKSF